MKVGHNGVDNCLVLQQEIYSLIEEEASQLSKDIGVPLCMSKCGKCCELNPVTASGPEARLMEMWIQQQPDKKRKAIIADCEKWLTERDKYINVYRGIGTSQSTSADIDRANNEAQYIFAKLPCPLLDDDKRCMIYPVRPLVCRTFGVSRVIGWSVCERPIGNYEAKGFRAYRENSKNIILIKKYLHELKNHILDKYRQTNIYVATAIYSEVEPQKFMTLLYHNLIPTARLLHFNETAILWQDHWQEINDREAELRFLCSPVPELDDPRDKTSEFAYVRTLVKGEEDADGT